MAIRLILVFVVFCAIIQINETTTGTNSTPSDPSGGVGRIVSVGLGQEKRSDILKLIKQQSGREDTSDNRETTKKKDIFKDIFKFANLPAAKRFVLQTVESWFTSNNVTASSECARDIQRLIKSTMSGEKWPIPFLDASGKPGPSVTKGWLDFVGSYDQCRDAVAPPLTLGRKTGFKGEYCVLHIKTVDILPASNVGLCLPQTCSKLDINVIADTLISSLNLNFTFKSVDCLTGETEVTAATVLAIISLATFGILMILGTGYDLMYVQTWIWTKKNDSLSPDTKCLTSSIAINSEPKNYETISNNNQDSSSEASKTSRMAKIILAFSVYTNGKNILKVNCNSESLTCVHGLRYLSICWVVLGHTYLLATTYTQNKTTVTVRYLHRWTFDVIANAFLSVDTFFTLSGLLTSYLTLKEMDKKGWKLNWPLFYFHRFWRLTPPYMFVIVISLGLTQYVGEGPLWSNEQPVDKKYCEDNWWKNLLYINNFQKFDEICVAQSWYLPNDMQFYCVSPLMLIPLYLHRVAGIASCLVFLSASWIITFAMSAANEWMALAASMDLTPEKKVEWEEDYYIKPWCRIGPFILGILAGYLLAFIKGKGESIKMKWWVVVLGWIITTGSALTVIYGLQGDISGEHPSSNGVKALYNSLARSVWGAAICWIIIACDAGYGGPVNTFLSWSPFVVLGRMTYVIYLVHVYVLTIFYENMGSPFFTNTTTMTIYFIGCLAFTNFFSFFFMLCFESPFIGLEKAFLPQKKTKLIPHNI